MSNSYYYIPKLFNEKTNEKSKKQYLPRCTLTFHEVYSVTLCGIYVHLSIYVDVFHEKCRKILKDARIIIGNT